MKFAFLILILIPPVFARALEVLDFLNGNITISINEQMNIKIGDEIEFDDENLEPIGRGRVIKISMVKKIAFVEHTGGYARKGMGYEILNEKTRVPNTVQEFKSTLKGEDLAIFENGEIGPYRHVGGGILGIYPGFGLGQLLEKRYKEAAISAAGELGTFGALWVVVPLVCGFGSSNYNCAVAIGDVGLSVIVGVKIWEIYDSWWGPVKYNRRYRELKSDFESHKVSLRPYISPEPRGSYAGLRWEF